MVGWGSCRGCLAQSRKRKGRPIRIQNLISLSSLSGWSCRALIRGIILSKRSKKLKSQFFFTIKKKKSKGMLDSCF